VGDPVLISKQDSCLISLYSTVPRAEHQTKDRLLAEIEAKYRTDFHSFVRVAAAFTGDVNTGLDVVQDAFSSAVKSRLRFRADGSLEAWLWSIVLNKARTAQRSAQQQRREREQVAPRAEPVEEHDQGAQEWLRARVAALPERQRQVVFLRYYADMDYRGIAEVLGVATGTVSATLSAAHAALRIDEPTEVSR
jgi:RNA polymerase sigma-70 factor, ECF subfamily